MAVQPNYMKVGVALGMFGGVVSMIALAYSWIGDLDGLYGAGLNMLCAAMFFAVAGAFTNHSPVPGNTLIALCAVAIAAAVVSMLYDATLLWVDALLVIIGAVCLLIAAHPGTTNWVDANRII